MSSVGLRLPISAPHRMLVHWSRRLGVMSSTSLSLSSLNGSVAVSVRFRMPLALSNPTHSGECEGALSSKSPAGLVRGCPASTSLNQAAAFFYQKASSFTLLGTAYSAGQATRTLLSSNTRSRCTMRCNFTFLGSQMGGLGLEPPPMALGGPSSARSK